MRCILGSNASDVVNLKKLTAERFSSEWKFFSEINSFFEEEFLDYLYPIRKEYFKDKIVLDAGCGNGRFAYYAARFQAKKVIAIDISDSVRVAKQNLSAFTNTYVIKADIYNLPFKEKFDFIYSIGVLHHLPEPEDGFIKLIEMLKDGGGIFVWVYGKEGNGLFLAFIEPIRKYITSRLPFVALKYVSLFLVIILWLILTLIYKPLNKFKIFEPLAKLLPMNKYLLYQYHLGFGYLWLTTLDKISPVVVNYYAKAEFSKWFSNARLKEILISQRNGNSWRGFGIK